MSDPLIETPLHERTTAAVLAKQAALRPDKMALIGADGSRLTYREIQERAQRISSGLTRLGVGRGEKILLLLDNHLDNVLTWFGAAAGAMISIPINSAFKGEMLAYVIHQSQASVLVIEGAWCDRLAAIADLVPGLTTVVVRGRPEVELPGRFRVIDLTDLDDPDPRPIEPPAVSDVVSILFTSGTEGRSKGVMCPHGHAFSMASYPPLTDPDEVLLVALPLFHAAGLWAGVYNALRCGGTAVVLGGFSASRFWSQVREHACTSTILMGGMIDFLTLEPPGPHDRDHTLRSAAVLPSPANAAAVTDRFGFRISSAYGLTEAGTVSIAEDGMAQAGSCGKPRSFIRIRLVDEDGQDVAPGEAGEILLRSTEPWSTMVGYDRMPAETVAVWQDLWLHTGDAARMDPVTGELFYIDRRKDSLRRRGENISSFEVERHILERADVAEVAVVAVASELTEDELKAVLVLRDECPFSPVEILRDLYRRMPYFMVPRYYEVVETLPRTPTHKVMKQQLRTQGITTATWDAHAAGFRILRNRLVEPSSS
jgi:crotonobetaine/carnitine-CoA ligase